MKCPNCKNTIGKQSIQCPRCGQLMPRRVSSGTAAKMTMNSKLSMAVGLLLLFIGFVLLINGTEYLSILPMVLGTTLMFVGSKMKS